MAVNKRLEQTPSQTAQLQAKGVKCEAVFPSVAVSLHRPCNPDSGTRQPGLASLSRGSTNGHLAPQILAGSLLLLHQPQQRNEDSAQRKQDEAGAVLYRLHSLADRAPFSAQRFGKLPAASGENQNETNHK